MGQPERGLAKLRPAEPMTMPTITRCIPACCESGFQLLCGILPGAGEGIDTYVPWASISSSLYDRPQTATWCQARLRSLRGKVAVGDIQFVDDSGRVLVKLEGVRLRRVPRDWLARWLAGPLPDWCVRAGLGRSTVGQCRVGTESRRAGTMVDLRLPRRPVAPQWPSGWK